MDHISIRRMQIILAKVFVVLGGRLLLSVSFEGFTPPATHTSKWGAVLKYDGSHAELQGAPAPQLDGLEFDVVVGADGEQTVVGKLAQFETKVFQVWHISLTVWDLSLTVWQLSLTVWHLSLTVWHLSLRVRAPSASPSTSRTAALRSSCVSKSSLSSGEFSPGFSMHAICLSIHTTWSMHTTCLSIHTTCLSLHTTPKTQALANVYLTLVNSHHMLVNSHHPKNALSCQQLSSFACGDGTC
jgi:hypothetical protein